MSTFPLKNTINKKYFAQIWNYSALHARFWMKKAIDIFWKLISTSLEDLEFSISGQWTHSTTDDGSAGH